MTLTFQTSKKAEFAIKPRFCCGNPGFGKTWVFGASFFLPTFARIFAKSNLLHVTHVNLAIDPWFGSIFPRKKLQNIYQNIDAPGRSEPRVRHGFEKTQGFLQDPGLDIKNTGFQTQDPGLPRVNQGSTTGWHIDPCFFPSKIIKVRSKTNTKPSFSGHPQKSC